MLETAEGIENAEAIAALPGIDVLLIGSGDLTTDYGIPGRSTIRVCERLMSGSRRLAVPTARCWASAVSAIMSSCKAS